MTDFEKWHQSKKAELAAIKTKTQATEAQAAMILTMRELVDGIQALGEEMSGLAAILETEDEDLPYN